MELDLKCELLIRYGVRISFNEPMHPMLADLYARNRFRQFVNVLRGEKGPSGSI